MKTSNIPANAHFAFLDQLQKSGLTNMFGAVPYLEQVYGMSNDHATTILAQWMAQKEEETK